MKHFYKLFFFSFIVFVHHLQPLAAAPNPFQKKAHHYDLAVCAIFQNEAPYLKEWIEFHKLVGVEHFYLYNNLSTDNYKEVLQPYIDAKIVDLTEWPFAISEELAWFTIQCDAYNHALKKGRHAEWLAFIDSDEFLVPVQKDSLVEALEEFKGCGGVGINWQLYGTSKIAKIPDNIMLVEALVYKAVDDYGSNCHVKSIVCPRYVKEFQNSHYAKYKKGYFHVDENHNVFKKNATEKVSVEKLRINHYWTRDRNYFLNVKLASRMKRGWSIEHDLKVAEMLNSVYDPIMLRFVPKLREQMGLTN